MGLRGMQERVEQFDGTLEIHSDGKGTAILVTLPLAEEAVSPQPAHSPKDEHGQNHQRTKPLTERIQAA